MVKNVEDITFNYVYKTKRNTEEGVRMPFIYDDTVYTIVIASDHYPEYPSDKYFTFIDKEDDHIDYLIDKTLLMGFKFKKDTVKHIIEFINGEHFAEIHNNIKKL